MVRWTALGLALLVAPGVARADWHYTRWGMTPAGVQAAAPRPLAAIPVRALEGTHLPRPLADRFTGFGRRFDVSLHFRDGRLGLVAMLPDRCAGLLEALKRTYGRRPATEWRGGRTAYLWRDRRRGNLITFFTGAPIWDLFYEPLPPRA